MNMKIIVIKARKMINNPAVGSVLCVLQERPAVRSSYEQSVPPLAESLH